MIASRNVNIVTKHINLNDKEKMSGRLIPVTADEENINEIQTHIDKLESELDDYKHNYKALKEFYDNSVAYGSKLQNELNTLKKDVARYFELKKAFDEDTNNSETISEFHEGLDLEEKLSKVGEEE